MLEWLRPVENRVFLKISRVRVGEIADYRLGRLHTFTGIHKADGARRDVFDFCQSSGTAHAAASCSGDLNPKPLQVYQVNEAPVHLVNVVRRFELRGNTVIDTPGPIGFIIAVDGRGVESWPFAPLQPGLLAHDALARVKLR
ncbi:hypothetical protein IMSAGC006_02178 [Muribaculaceae bacterium]|nr:hypothetical protein IMSAGC006_02178 [Muribaculaceae bacterium]